MPTLTMILDVQQVLLPIQNIIDPINDKNRRKIKNLSAIFELQ